jgi:hypothetical protein
MDSPPFPESPYGGADVDDLAALVCAALIRAGLKPEVIPYCTVGAVNAHQILVIKIAIHIDNRPVAIFPCRPVAFGPGIEASLKRIEKGK